MDLQLSEEQSDFRAAIRGFLDKEATIATVRELAEAEPGFDRSWWRRACELGLAAPLVPEDLGGGSVSGAPIKDLALIAEECGRSVAPGPLSGTNIALAALVNAESSAPRHGELIEKIVSGELVAAWAVQEPLGAWNPLAPNLVAKQGAAGFVLDGAKDRVEFGGQADVLIVTAHTEGGVSQFVVPTNTVGVTIEQSWSIDLTRRFAVIRFDAVELGEDALVGELDGAAESIEYQCDLASVIGCAETVGMLTAVFDLTVEWAFGRYTFGRPLASYQALKHRFADMRTWLEACAAVSVNATDAVYTGHARAETVSAAVSYIGDTALAIMQDCVQIHGGIGVTWEHDLHLYLRRAVVNRAMYGTPEDHQRRLADLIEL